MAKRKLIVVGAGGFGQEIVWAARNMNAVRPSYDILGYCDDDTGKRGQSLYDSPVLGVPEDVDGDLAEKPWFVCAIGNNKTRVNVVQRLLGLGWQPAVVIDPSVIVADGVRVDPGTYVGAGSILSPYAHVGSHVIINHNCSIGHDSVLEDFVQISPGGRVSGECVIKEGATLGSNAVVVPGKSVGRYAILGACSLAIRNIRDGVTAIGIPARVTSRGAK